MTGCEHYNYEDTCPDCDDGLLDAVCRGCETVCENEFATGELKYHQWARNDAYGLYTGLYCDSCYKSDRYPYRTDRYFDPAYAGEQMDEDY